MQEAQSFSSTCGVKTLQVSSTTLLFHYSSCCLLCTQITSFLYFLLEFCNYPPFPFTDSCLFLYSAFLQGLLLFPLFYKTYPSSLPLYWMLNSPHPPTLFISYSPCILTDIIFPHTHLLNLFLLVLLCSCTYPPPLPMSYWLTPSPPESKASYWSSTPSTGVIYNLVHLAIITFLKLFHPHFVRMS